MKVKAFRLQNLPNIPDTGWIELKPITLLFGRNSSGKSAILRALKNMAVGRWEAIPSAFSVSFRYETSAPIDYARYNVHSLCEAAIEATRKRALTGVAPLGEIKMGTGGRGKPAHEILSYPIPTDGIEDEIYDEANAIVEEFLDGITHVSTSRPRDVEELGDNPDWWPAYRYVTASELDWSEYTAIKSAMDAMDLGEIEDDSIGLAVLPVLAGVVTARPNTLTLIEQPELHLHPRDQAGMGSLLASATGTLVAETNSEMLMLRVQKLIRKGLLESNDVAVYVASDNVVSRIEMDTNGDFIADWPGGFFEERLEELFDSAES